MDHAMTAGPVRTPPLRNFLVKLRGSDEVITVTAHWAFNNKARGEGLIFRRYYGDDVRTYVVAEFDIDTFDYFTETK